MDPQSFVRLSIGSLGLRIPAELSKSVTRTDHLSSQCSCKIRLRGFPVQTASVPLLSSPEASPNSQSNSTIFYLDESGVKALLIPGCFQGSQAYLEIFVYMGRRGSHCGISGTRQLIGMLRLEVGSELGKGKSAVLHSGWIYIGKNKGETGKQRPELHLRVKLDPDPRYIFQFQDETRLSPQIVQIQGTIKQPIFSCKFIRDRRPSSQDSVGKYCSNSYSEDLHDEDKERKGWKVLIHDLSGSAVAAACMATPFVPSMGYDVVSRTNPGAWLILRSDPACTYESWHPWGRLEAWRETAPRGFVCLRFYLLPEGLDAGVLVSEVFINPEKGGEFFIDMDRQTPLGTPIPNQERSTDSIYSTSFGEPTINGFVMNCKVQGEGKCSKPLVHLGMQHVTCMDDAAIFMALAAAVDLSIKACRPFRRKPKKTRATVS